MDSGGTRDRLGGDRTPAGTDSIPLFLRIEEQLSADGLDWCIRQLEGEVHRCVGVEPKDFSKAAVRMYNIFRLKGFHEEASYLRDLFDEPATMLYRVSSLLHNLETQPGLEFDRDAILTEVDELILTVKRTLEDDEEAAIVTHLQRLRDDIGEEGILGGRSEDVGSARDRMLCLVNDFFYDRLTAVPSLRNYIVKLELGM